MAYKSNFSDEFFSDVKAGIANARAQTLRAGVSLFYRDAQSGMELMEHPDGRLFEIRYIPNATGDSNYEVLREVTRTAA